MTRSNVSDIGYQLHALRVDQSLPRCLASNNAPRIVDGCEAYNLLRVLNLSCRQHVDAIFNVMETHFRHKSFFSSVGTSVRLKKSVSKVATVVSGLVSGGHLFDPGKEQSIFFVLFVA